jgi:cyclopropane fatty-acyl-phospholipid synthase-like methyltransferase
MSDSSNIDFYETYSRFKEYSAPNPRAKESARFEEELWLPAGCAKNMSFLEIGCGSGHFLAYLREKGVTEFLGIDHDSELANHVPAVLADHFRVADVWEFLDSNSGARRFDRIVMLDVLEHFTAEDGARLLAKLARILRTDGRIVVRVPNMSSPWGAQYQFGDLTHRAAYNPTSMRQLAEASGFSCVACYPHLQRSPSRRILDRLFHALLSRLLMTPPEIWSANFFAILERRED